MRRRPLLLLLLCLLAGAQLLGAGAQDAARDPLQATDVRQVAGGPHGSPLDGASLDRRTEEIAGLLRCPVCQGLSIADSPASLAKQMKGLVRLMLAAGYDESQILAYFEYSYGEFVLLRPPVRGFAALLWIGPLAALLIGGAVLTWRLRRAGTRAAASRATADVEGTGAPSPVGSGTVAAADRDALAPYLERVRRIAHGEESGVGAQGEVRE